MDNYRVENISMETIMTFKSCFDKNGSPKSVDKIKWQFLECPVNKQFVHIASDLKNNRTAAIYAVFPVLFQINGYDFIGSQSLDTITDEEYRGKGLFVNLAKDVYEKCSSEDVKLVYGFPNGNSIHGFSKKLAWEVLDPVPFLMKPIYTGYFSRKIKKLSWLPNLRIAFSSKIAKNINIVVNNEFPEDVDRIWKNFSKEIRVSVKRDKQYLSWRYLRKPNEDYKIAHAYTSGGSYIGYVIYCVKEKHGGKIAYIMEYVYDPQFYSLADNLLKFAVNELIKQKSDCILSWCMEHSPNYNSYRKNGFYNLPERFRPIELHFGVRSFDEKYFEIVNKRSNWYLSYSDSDTV